MSSSNHDMAVRASALITGRAGESISIFVTNVKKELRARSLALLPWTSRAQAPPTVPPHSGRSPKLQTGLKKENSDQIVELSTQTRTHMKGPNIKAKKEENCATAFDLLPNLAFNLTKCENLYFECVDTKKYYNSPFVVMLLVI